MLANGDGFEFFVSGLDRFYAWFDGPYFSQ